MILPCITAPKAALDTAKGPMPLAAMPNLHIIRKQDGQRMTCRRMAEVMLAERQRLELAAYAFTHCGIAG